ncbi:MAG: peptidoglycan DD-metalloendopeptidase family protein [Opitutales bacterium]
MLRNLAAFLLILCAGPNLRALVDVRWPVREQRPYLEALPPAHWAQPTISGRVESALFGCVRNGGHRFHEAIDIAPAEPRRRGEATDPVIAALPGRVLGINPHAGNSSYGRYVVLVHEDQDVPVYTLYSHLARIAEGLDEGDWVELGETVGIMGRSASYAIPRSRAHLHFEIGLMKSARFDDWYHEQPYGSKNRFGNANGINLIGMDPLPFFAAARKGLPSLSAYFDSLPTAFSLRISTNRVPDFVERYPALLTRPIPDDGELVAWLVDYTWYGLPFRWTPLTAAEVPPARTGDVSLMFADESAFAGRCRETIEFGRDGSASLGDNLRNDLAMIFGFY